jgi:hypothetical protein
LLVNILVYNLYLTVRLRVKGSKQLKLNIKDLIKLILKVRDKLRAIV